MSNELSGVYSIRPEFNGGSWQAWVIEDPEQFAKLKKVVLQETANERARILQWIEENRSAIELEPGEYIYRDHFNSESLIAFIKGENK